MSLQDLPTEPDVATLNHLWTCPRDLSRMTRVSKYYRKLEEPILYGDIGFWAHHSYQIKQLLLTLLRRKDFRRAVHSLCLQLNLDYEPQSPPLERDMF
jgi:hypothetical protein